MIFNMNLHNPDHDTNIAMQVLAAMLALLLLSAFIPNYGAQAEMIPIDEVEEEIELYDDPDWEDEYIILDDPAYFMTDEELDEIDYVDYAGTGGSAFESDEEESIVYDSQENDDSVSDLDETAADAEEAVSSSGIPVITSVGKTNVKVHGVKSKNKLIEYTIPEELLAADPNFLALMVEAEKYIGYPYVYGASNPSIGFDCSGFVSWVFMKSGVYDTGRRGANGLHSLCTEVDEADLRPGDLVFFKGTMGKDVKGITHVGIYVGNGMMIHAGDPVGFADIRSEKWSKKINCYGRLPY